MLRPAYAPGDQVGGVADAFVTLLYHFVRGGAAASQDMKYLHFDRVTQRATNYLHTAGRRHDAQRDRSCLTINNRSEHCTSRVFTWNCHHVS